eukprot:5228819-Alexandrium_andersonii.AAC.1
MTQSASRAELHEADALEDEVRLTVAGVHLGAGEDDQPKARAGFIAGALHRGADPQRGRRPGSS